MIVTGLSTLTGQKVLEVTGIGHSTVDAYPEWYFLCTLKTNAGILTDYALRATRIVYDPKDKAAIQSWKAMQAAMNRYLHEQGEWHEPRPLRSGMIVHWTPHKPKGDVTIVDLL